MRGACVAKERHHTKTPRHFLQNSNHPQVFRKEVSVRPLHLAIITVEQEGLLSSNSVVQIRISSTQRV